jgi:hypothetical protein
MYHWNMAKGQFWHDTFEQIAELGGSTAKKTVKAVTQTLNPLNTLTPSTETLSKEQQEKMKSEAKKNNNSTPLDFNKLQQTYQDQDKIKEDALRRRLFQLVKDDEKKVIETNKQEKAQKEQQEAQDDVNKKKHLEEKNRQTESGSSPKGKERKSVLGGGKKKASMEQHAEYKPSTGKS